MMKPSEKSDIQKAVEKMELESKRSKKLRAAAHTQKAHEKSSFKSERDERIKAINKQGKKDFDEILDRLKRRALLVSITFIVALLYTYSLSESDRVTLVQDVIILFVLCGLIAAAAFKK